ncbi:uncharacterized protein M421DRAFT_200147 [Didymella exigua CBS 183.55]|uniref:Uncharacterized protein n=1 Tax=Didymella exigua CBS 183.55 TaxID=1150837 RepID=A0A6A5S2C0_9PLEO|nr:uncharacterized protein M421DRAFT_200147 [Didymella exigua CBS 183.55]KAF1933564.1 hypothetical protein M421DRAFT_200147 [Didymella exigua CBS 183.55]
MNLGPTIYPLAFAAIGSRCLRNVAIYLAERGTTLATLEKLLGSQSLVSAISTAFTLRSASLTSIGLLLLWALSPLGGQSSLRLLHEGNTTISEAGTIYYSDHAAPQDLEEAATWFSIIPAILSASLASSAEAKALPVDLWSHPKVPRLDAIENEVLAGDGSTGRWVTVNMSDPAPIYTSLAGINVQGLHRNTTSTFQVKYNYLRLGCEKFIGGTDAEVLDYLWNTTTFSMWPPILDFTPGVSPATLLTNTTININFQTLFLPMSFFLRYGWNSPGASNNGTETTDGHSQISRQPVSFLYGAQFNAKDTFQVYKCAPRVVTVNAQIECQADECAVSRLRRVPGESSAELENACDTGSQYRLGCLTSGTYALRNFFMYFASAIANYYSPYSMNPFDGWIAGNDQTYSSIPTASNRTLSEIPDQLISDRLTTVLNTYWQAGAWGSQITRAGMFDTPEYPYVGPNDGGSRNNVPDRFLNTTGTVFKTQVPIYKAEVGWIVTLLLITIALLILCVINIIISITNKAPDLFYYASSLARENPYTNTPDGGTSLDGAERTRLLRGMKVQIADVSPDNEVGYVVLKSLGEGEDARTGRLRKDRLYR